MPMGQWAIEQLKASSHGRGRYPITKVSADTSATEQSTASCPWQDPRWKHRRNADPQFQYSAARGGAPTGRLLFPHPRNSDRHDRGGLAVGVMAASALHICATEKQSDFGSPQIARNQDAVRSWP